MGLWNDSDLFIFWDYGCDTGASAADIVDHKVPLKYLRGLKQQGGQKWPGFGIIVGLPHLPSPTPERKINLHLLKTLLI